MLHSLTSRSALALILFVFLPLWSHERPARAETDAKAREATETSKRLSVVAAGHLKGQLAEVNCRRPAPQRGRNLPFAHQVGYFAGLEEEGLEPLALGVGDSIFPGAIPRYLLQTSDAERSLASILGEIPWALHALGKRELVVAVRELARFAAQAEQAGLPIQSANMHCREGAADDAFCRALEHRSDNPPWTIAERKGLRIGLVALTDPETRDYVAEDRLDLVEIVKPDEILPGIVRDLRRDQGVDLVFVVHHGHGDGAFDRLHELLSHTSGVDLALTNVAPRPEDTAGAGSTPRGFIVAPTTKTRIVGARTGHESLVTIDVDVSRNERQAGWRIERIAPMSVSTESAKRDAEAARALASAIRELCESWATSINPDLPLASPFSMEDFQTFVLGILRSVSRAEVAVANTASFRQPELFPLLGSLTFADVYTVLAFNNRLRVLELTGGELKKLRDRLDDDYVTFGLETREGSLRVNGRAVIDDATYRVATNSFLAAGGEGFFEGIDIADSEAFSPPWAEEPPTIPQIVTRYVDTLRAAPPGEPSRTLHPKASFPDLHRKPLWQFRAAIDGSYNQVSVRNPESAEGSSYERPQLAVSPTSQINFEARGGIQADSRFHRWGNEFLLQYAVARAEENGELGSFRENKDVTQLRSQYRYNGIRDALEGSWYAPAPFAELQLETELRVPDDRDHRRLALTGIVGPELQLFEPFTVFAGANARRDVSQPAGEFGYGLAAGYRLQRLSVFDSLGTSAEIESDLQLYLNRIDDDREQELRSTSRLFFTIIGELSFTTTLSSFLYRRASVGELGFNTSLTVGLNYSWNRAYQAR